MNRNHVVGTLLFTPLLSEALVAQDLSRWSSFCEDARHTAGIALGDLDGDGDLDIVFANGRHTAESDWAYLNDGHGTFYGRRQLESQSDRSYGVSLGDLDGDGAGALLPMAGLGSGTLAEARRAVTLSDLDGDGDLDVVLVGVGQDHIYLNEDAGRRWTQLPLGDETARGLSVVADDLDSDGDADIVVAYRAPGRVIVYHNDGKGGFSEAQTLAVGQSDPTSLALSDLDGDSILDLVIANWERPHLVYLGSRGGAFAAAGAFGSGSDQAWSVAVGDMDLDGDLDVVVGAANVGDWFDDLDKDGTPDRFGNEAGPAPSRIYVNDGSGNLSAGTPIGAGYDDTRPVAIGDIDGDGDLDVVMGNDCQPSRVFFNSVRLPSPS